MPKVIVQTLAQVLKNLVVMFVSTNRQAPSIAVPAITLVPTVLPA